MRSTASAASWAVKAAMEVYNVQTTCTLVEVVYVLRYECDSREEIRELRDGMMGWIRVALKHHATSVFIPAPHDITLARKG